MIQAVLEKYSGHQSKFLHFGDLKSLKKFIDKSSEYRAIISLDEADIDSLTCIRRPESEYIYISK